MLAAYRQGDDPAGGASPAFPRPGWNVPAMADWSVTARLPRHLQERFVAARFEALASWRWMIVSILAPMLVGERGYPREETLRAFEAQSSGRRVLPSRGRGGLAGRLAVRKRLRLVHGGQRDTRWRAGRMGAWKSARATMRRPCARAQREERCVAYAAGRLCEAGVPARRLLPLAARLCGVIGGGRGLLPWREGRPRSSRGCGACIQPRSERSTGAT
jgi:hypothetical protein